MKSDHMKKIITFLFISCLAVSAINAQVDVGVKAGLNLTNISGEINTDDYDILSSPGSKLGYHFGGFLRASLFGLFIQPELVFTSIASEFTVTDKNTAVEELGKQKIGRIDIPVIIGANLGSLRLGIGPVGSIIVSEKSDLTDITGYETKLKSATFGYHLGVGLNIWKLGFDIRYEGNLTKLGDQIVVGGQALTFDSRAKQGIFSLSYSF